MQLLDNIIYINDIASNIEKKNCIAQRNIYLFRHIGHQ